MVEEARASVKGVDAVLLLVDASSFSGRPDELLLEVSAGITVPVILAFNKIDLVPKDKLLEVIAAHAATLLLQRDRPGFRGDGGRRGDTGEASCRVVPEGAPYFPDDILTDLPERFIVAEIIREKVFRLTHDEIPYSTAVSIESFKERPDGAGVNCRRHYRGAGFPERDHHRQEGGHAEEDRHGRPGKRSSSFLLRGFFWSCL